MKSQLKDLHHSILMLLRLQRYGNQDSGYILVVVVVAMALTVPAILSTYALMSKVDTSTSNASARSNTGFYAAEAGLNKRASDIKSKFQGYSRPGGISPTKWEDCHDPNASDGGPDSNDRDSSGNPKNDFACDTSLNIQGQTVTTFVRDLNSRDANNRPIPRPTTIAPGEPFAGLNAQEYRYEVVSVARGSDSLPTAIVNMRFKSRLVPLFQFVVFYDNDADFSRPPSITLNGPVHTNGNLYLNASGTLTINGPTSTVGTLYRGRKDINATGDCDGTVSIYDPTTARALNCNSSRRAAYSTKASVSAWNNRINVGVARLNVPPPGNLDAVAGKPYWDNADLRIVLEVDANGNPADRNGNGTFLEVRGSPNNAATDSLQNSCTPNRTLQNEPDGTANYEAEDTQLRVNSVAGLAVDDFVTIDTSTDTNPSTSGIDLDSNVISAISGNTITLKRRLGHSSTGTTIVGNGGTVRKAIVSTSDTFYNYREKHGSSGVDAGNYIRMLNVDARGLLSCAHSQNLMGKALNDDTDGGLVWFLTVDGPNSTTNVTSGGSPNRYGVRVYNGAELTGGAGAPAIRGLTIASDQAVYTQGNYNSSNKKPASVIADTINVLSQAWKTDDSNGRGYLGDVPSTTVLLTASARQASTTTINAAFLSGTNITGGVNGTTGQDLGESTLTGGVHNYPRLHEDWSGTTLTYRGSLASLNPPRRVNSAFCGSLSTGPTCNIYDAPTRNWDFDTDFSNAGNLPPLSPQAVYLRQEFFSRDFERASINLSPSPLSLFPLNLFGLLYSPPSK